MLIDGEQLCPYCFSPLLQGVCPDGCAEAHRSVVALPLGATLNGKFRIGKLLGKGGFGITYLAYDTEKHDRVAIKEYFPDHMVHRNTGETMVLLSESDTENKASYLAGAEKYYNEAMLLSRFKGMESIVDVYEFFYANNTVYYTMEYIDGMDLKTYIRRCGGKIPENELVYIAQKIAEALIQVHSTGFLHRDIAPDNICLCRDGRVKLIDFGAARQVVGEKSKSLSVILKQGFAPIEQYQTHGRQGPWTDLYALGATLYYGGTGELIDDASTRVVDETLDVSAFSKEFGEILVKMLHVRISERMQSAVDLQLALLRTLIEPQPFRIDGVQQTQSAVHAVQSDVPTDTIRESTENRSVNFGEKRYIQGHQRASRRAALICGAGCILQLAALIAFLLLAPVGKLFLYIPPALLCGLSEWLGIRECRRFAKLADAQKDRYNKVVHDARIRPSVWLRTGSFALCAAICVVALIIGTRAYPALQYKKGTAEYAEGAYTQALRRLTLAGDYADADERRRDCEYRIAQSLMDAHEYLDAIEHFENARDYADSAEKIKGCMYLYASGDMDAEQSEDFLCALSEEGFRNSRELYEEMTRWSITLTAASDDDFSKDQDTLNLYGFIYFNFSVNGGKKGESIRLKVRITDTGGRTITETYKNAFKRGHRESYYLGYPYPHIGNVRSGKMTAEILNADTDKVLAKKTVNLGSVGAFTVRVQADASLYDQPDGNASPSADVRAGELYTVEEVKNGFGLIDTDNMRGWLALDDTERE